MSGIKNIIDIEEKVIAGADVIYRAVDLGLEMTQNGGVIIEPNDITSYEKAHASYTYQYTSDDGALRDGTGRWPVRVAIVKGELALVMYERMGGLGKYRQVVQSYWLYEKRQQIKMGK